MTKTDNEIKTVGDAKVEQEKKLSNHDNMKRNYDDNIKLREYVKQVGTKFAATSGFFLTFSKKLKPEKTQLSKKLKDFSGQNSTNR